MRPRRHQRKTVFWESSLRPLYPKWVWMAAAGHRHFMLDKVSCDINDNLGKKQQSLQCLDVAGIGDSSTVNNSDERVINPTSNINSIDAGSRPTQKTVQPNAVQQSPPSDNQLTGRVLQWLDLAGRTTNVRPIDRNHETIAPKLPLASASRRSLNKSSARNIEPTNASEQTVSRRRRKSLPPLSSDNMPHQLVSMLSKANTLNATQATRVVDFTFDEQPIIARRRPATASVAKPSAKTTNDQHKLPPLEWPSNGDDTTVSRAPIVAASIVDAAAHFDPHQFEYVPPVALVSLQQRKPQHSSATYGSDPIARRRQLHIFMPNLPEHNSVASASNASSTVGGLDAASSSGLGGAERVG